jgi:hypothetical protein
VLRFDGHKGEPLFFDNQQRLVQPTVRVTRFALGEFRLIAEIVLTTA